VKVQHFWRLGKTLTLHEAAGLDGKLTAAEMGWTLPHKQGLKQKESAVEGRTTPPAPSLVPAAESVDPSAP